MHFDVNLVLSWIALGIIGAYVANRMRAQPLPILDVLSFAALGGLFFGLAGWAVLDGLLGSAALALIGGAAAIGLAPRLQPPPMGKRKWRVVR
ncbi:MAG TPA: hypothetical protein VJM53_11705 [Burkholderiales bacterium]|nr:hypothetical protein [Burkholderiales bacterium]